MYRAPQKLDALIKAGHAHSLTPLRGNAPSFIRIMSYPQRWGVACHLYTPEKEVTGEIPRAQAYITNKTSLLTRMAQQHHHENLSQHQVSLATARGAIHTPTCTERRAQLCGELTLLSQYAAPVMHGHGTLVLVISDHHSVAYR